MIENPPANALEDKIVRFHTVVPSGVFRYWLSTSGITSVLELREKTGALYFDSRAVPDVTGIEYATNLTELIMYSAYIDVPIDISESVNLVRLHASNNQIPSFGSLRGMTNLTLCAIDNNIIDLPTLEQIVIDLWNNRVALGALSCEIHLQGNTGSATTATTKATEIAALVAAGCTVNI